MRTVRIGSRKSRLAVVQAELVAETLRRSHPDLKVEIVTMDTAGDILKDRPLDDVGGKGLFTLELEQALRAGTVDLSVHSLKDMPEELPQDLPILAFSKREDPRDALVLPKGAAYRGLGALSSALLPVGCSSSRRTVQLRRLCPALRIAPVRGNVPTRLRKMNGGDYSALVLAAAGLKRLGLAGNISRYFSEEEMLPAAGQGILAVQGPKSFDRNLLAAIDDPDGRTAAVAERTVIRRFACGCSSPAAAFCRVSGNEVSLRAFYVDPGSGRQVSGGAAGDRSSAQRLAEELAERLLREVRADG